MKRDSRPTRWGILWLIVAGALLPLLPFALDILAGRMDALDILALMAAGGTVALIGYGVADRRNRAAWAELEEMLSQRAATIDEDRRVWEERLRTWDAESRAWAEEHGTWEEDGARRRAELDAYVAALVATHAKPRGGRPRGSVWPRGYTLADYLPHLATAAGVRDRGESLTDWARSHIWPDGSQVHVNTVRTWLTREAAAVEEWRTRNPDASFSCTRNPPPPINRGPIE
jgi:hypothetical protein